MTSIDKKVEEPKFVKYNPQLQEYETCYITNEGELRPICKTPFNTKQYTTLTLPVRSKNAFLYETKTKNIDELHEFYKEILLLGKNNHATYIEIPHNGEKNITIIDGRENELQHNGLKKFAGEVILYRQVKQDNLFQYLRKKFDSYMIFMNTND